MESRQSLLAQADAILSRPNFTREDKSKVDGILSLCEALDPHRQELRRARMTQIELDAGLRTEGTRARDEIHQAFMTALRYGAGMLPDEVRAMGVGTDGAGGYLSSSKFSNSLYANMAVFDRLLDPAVVDIQTTDTGGAFSWPIIDNSSASATIIPENGIFNEAADAIFDAPIFMAKAQTWRADLIRVSLELLQDSRFRLDDVLSTSFGIRLGRGVGSSFMQTLLSEATLGKAAAAGQTSSIVYEDIVDVVSSVDEVYRQSPKCGWMCRQSTLDAIQKLKDSSGRPLGLIEYGLNGLNRVPYLSGYPVYISPSVPVLGPGSPAVGNKCLLCGDFNAWKIRFVADSLRVRRLNERFAEYGQCGFTATLRANAGLGRASTAASPIVYFETAAS
jgi:HK97 family phage major capsid protein